MARLVTREVLRRTADRVLAPLGARILSCGEQAALDDRHRSVVHQLYAVQVHRFFPPLEERQGRLDLLCQLRGTEVSEALHLLHCLQQALAGPGDVCEFGVAQGATSALIANEILDEPRTFWLYDSFQGLSKPSEQDTLTDDIFSLGTMDRYAGTMAFPREQLRSRLRSVGFPERRARIVEGFIRPDLPADLLPPVVAFAYLDFDLYKPILIALRLLHERCRSGSLLLVDDYGYFSSGPETAVKEFIAEHPDQYALLEGSLDAGHFCVLRRL